MSDNFTRPLQTQKAYIVLKEADNGLARRLRKLQSTLQLTALSLAYFCSGAHAELSLQETDWMNITPGFEESKIGARIEEIFQRKTLAELTPKEKKVNISLPTIPGKKIEEVVVIGKRKKDIFQIDLKREVEIIKDFKEGRTGIVIYLENEGGIQLRINYIDYLNNAPNIQ